MVPHTPVVLVVRRERPAALIAHLEACAHVVHGAALDAPAVRAMIGLADVMIAEAATPPADLPATAVFVPTLGAQLPDPQSVLHLVGRRATPARLAVADGEIDLARGVISRHGTGARLTGTELRLVACLARSAASAVPTGVLCLHVLGYAEGAKTRALTTLIHRVRQKLEANPSRPATLVTRRGHGYALVEAPAAAGPPPILVETSALVGREAELAALTEAWAHGRAVALSGPPGVGKTALVRHFADTTLAAADVLHVDLHQRTSDSDVLTAFIDAVGATTRGPDVAGDIRLIGQLLGAREAPVLVIDHADGTLGSIGRFLTSWRTALPQLGLILVSRSQTAVPDSRPVRLGPLTPARGAELFRARYDEVCPHATWDEEAEEAALRIATSFDGIPLAIELAASWGGVATPRDIAARTAERPPDVLDAAFDASWLRLGPEERDTLAACALFSGPFSVEELERVLAPAASDKLLTHLSSLYRASLITSRRATPTAPRLLSVYSVIRHFVRARRTPSETLRRRHDAYLLAHAKAHADTLERGSEQAPQALQWFARAAGDIAALADRLAERDAPSDRAALAMARWRHLLHVGRVQEALAVVRDVLRAHDSALDAMTQARLTLREALALQWSGAHAQAMTAAVAAEAIATENDVPGRLVRAYAACTQGAISPSKAAEAALERAFATFDALASDDGLAHVAYVRATLASRADHTHDALAYINEAEERFERAGTPRMVAHARLNRGLFLAAIGDFDGAMAAVDSGRALCERIHHTNAVVRAAILRCAIGAARRPGAYLLTTLLPVAHDALACGHVAAAARLYATTSAACAGDGAPTDLLRQAAEPAVRLARETSDLSALVYTRAIRGGLRALQGDHHGAAADLGWATATVRAEAALCDRLTAEAIRGAVAGDAARSGPNDALVRGVLQPLLDRLRSAGA